MGQSQSRSAQINMSIIAKLCLLAAAAPAATGFDGRRILLGNCTVHPGTVKDNIILYKFLHNLTKDECHAQAAVEFKKCSNKDESPITATYELYKTGVSSTISFPKRKGNCYVDYPTRILPYYMGAFWPLFPSECNKKCAEKNFSYFGLEYYHECWCGKTAPQEDQQASVLMCSAPCAGNDNKEQKCGGAYFMNVWKVCKDQDCKFSYE